MKNRIAVFAPFFTNDFKQNRPYFVANVLTKFGPVDIVTTNFDHLTKKRKEKKQIAGLNEIIYIKTLRYKSNISINRFLSHILFSVRAAWYFKNNHEKYQIIYVTVPFNLMALLVLGQAKKQKKIIDIIDIWPDVLPFPVIVRKLLWPLMKIWKNLFIKSCQKADIMIAVSDRFLLQGQQYFNASPINAKRFYIGCNPFPEIQIKKKELLTIVYIGNIGRLYDFEALIQALDDADLINKCQLYIVGDGDKREWLIEELTRRKILFTYFGIIYDPTELTFILKTAHLGFNGYTQKTSAAFSYKANTYLAAGLPLLNSMGGDLYNLVENKDLGFNYKAGDYLHLRSILQHINLDKLGELSFNCNKVFEEELNHNKLIKQMTEFFIRNI